MRASSSDESAVASAVDEPVVDEPAVDEAVVDEAADGAAPAPAPAPGDGAAADAVPPGRLRRVRDGLAAGVFPAATVRAERWWTVLLLGAAWVVLSLARVPWPSTFQRIWAEDGAVFLADASRSPLWFTLTRPYAGYLHTLPRTLAEIVALLPARDLAAGLAVATALVVGACALLVHVVVRDVTGRRWAGLVAATYLVATPVGEETIGNLANLQWRLLPTALLAALWTPRSRWGVAAVGLVVLATTTSSPFGPLVVVVLLVRLLLAPSRRAVVVAVVGVVGAALQGVGMLSAPGRPTSPVPGLGRLVDQYALRVVGNGTLGEQVVATDLPLPLAIRVGQALLAVVVVALTVAAVRGGRTTAVRVLAFGSVGLATYLAPMVVSAPPLPDPAAARYYVAPAVLLAVTLLVAPVPRVPDDAAARALSPAGVRATLGRWWSDRSWSALPATAAFAVVMAVVGVAHLQLSGAAAAVTRWDTALVAARPGCEGRPDRIAQIPTNPTGWFALLPCRDVLDGS